MMRVARWLAVAIVVGLVSRSAAAATASGRVVSGGVPVPGATVTATDRDRRVVTATDSDGVYRLDLADGTWTIRIEMIGFAPIAKEVAVGADAAPATWDLTLLPFEEITRGVRSGAHDVP